MRSSESGSTLFITARLEWNVKCVSKSARRSIAGISVSIVVFELGTIRPTRRASWDVIGSDLQRVGTQRIHDDVAVDDDRPIVEVEAAVAHRDVHVAERLVGPAQLAVGTR